MKMNPGIEHEQMKALKRKGFSEAAAAKKLVSLKRSKKEKEEPANLPAKPSRDSYPYGTELHLEHDTLKKLGVKKLPAVGKKIKLRVHGHVTRTSQSDDGEGGNRSMHLQLTHMSPLDTDGDID